MDNLIGQRLKELRKRFGMTQKELAERAGVEQTTVSAAETGVRNPIWIRGVSTKGLVDGEAIELGSHFFVVAEPERYTNPMGSMTTVACIEYFNLTPWFPTIDAEVAKIIAAP